MSSCISLTQPLADGTSHLGGDAGDTRVPLSRLDRCPAAGLQDEDPRTMARTHGASIGGVLHVTL
ncbi:hypothetical protein Dda_6858 [Drechslerella dactyloides]|uniref:Uncharacterized protein n=1 Tax=Drechslerella dactyloides TaxID=74499 RepID=A0AAD6NHS9_DREDA|nr:hypothetical protein Dda_6858 [Drechslerella dactyloides]